MQGWLWRVLYCAVDLVAYSWYAEWEASGRALRAAY